MKVTLALLKDWGACQRALDWWEKDYPDGFEGTIDEILPIIQSYYDTLWFLKEVANRVDGKDGDLALRRYAELADAEWLFSGVISITKRDVEPIWDALISNGEQIPIAKAVFNYSGTKHEEKRKAAFAKLPKEMKRELNECMPENRRIK